MLGWAAVVGLGEALSLVDVVGRLGYVVGGAAPRSPPPASCGLAAGVRSAELPSLAGGGPSRASAADRARRVVLAAVGYRALPRRRHAAEQLRLADLPPRPASSAWLQQGHAGYYDAATARANAFPGNAELGILWTVALLGRDTLAALPQLLAELGLLACVYGIGPPARLGRPGSAVAALLTATLSQVALQSVTTQNDLVVASFVAAALYFVLGRVPA